MEFFHLARAVYNERILMLYSHIALRKWKWFVKQSWSICNLQAMDIPKQYTAERP